MDVTSPAALLVSTDHERVMRVRANQRPSRIKLCGHVAPELIHAAVFGNEYGSGSQCERHSSCRLLDAEAFAPDQVPLGSRLLFGQLGRDLRNVTERKRVGLVGAVAQAGEAEQQDLADHGPCSFRCHFSVSIWCSAASAQRDDLITCGSAMVDKPRSSRRPPSCLWLQSLSPSVSRSGSTFWCGSPCPAHCIVARSPE